MRVLNQDPVLKTLTLLGTLPTDATAEATGSTQQAILLIEKTHFAAQSAESDITHRISELFSTGSNDIYHWWNAALTSGQTNDPDLKMSVIFPATETVSCAKIAVLSVDGTSGDDAHSDHLFL